MAELRLTPVAQAMGEAGLRWQLDARYSRARLLSRIQLRNYLEAHERTMYERFISAKARRLGLTRATLHTGPGDEFLTAPRYRRYGPLDLDEYGLDDFDFCQPHWSLPS